MKISRQHLISVSIFKKDEENETPRSRLLFFGPKDDNLQLEEQIYQYYNYDKQLQPHCTTDRTPYVFLITMFYNDEAIKLDGIGYINSKNFIVK
uniref:DUF7583 domain-containing protein n=1 Tax=Strongyloides venezuelensis TaxID=75913 RepID=A0A0K0G5A9_STRVS